MSAFEVGKPAPYYCKACQAVPREGYCKMAECPTAPAVEGARPGRAEDNDDWFDFLEERAARMAAQMNEGVLRQQRDELLEALKVFAAIAPSSLYADDGSEQERYAVRLHDSSRHADPHDFTGADLARARAVIAKAEGHE